MHNGPEIITFLLALVRYIHLYQALYYREDMLKNADLATLTIFILRLTFFDASRTFPRIFRQNDFSFSYLLWKHVICYMQSREFGRNSSDLNHTTVKKIN